MSPTVSVIIANSKKELKSVIVQPGAAVPLTAVGELFTPIVLSPIFKVMELMMRGVGPRLHSTSAVEPRSIR